MPQDKPVVRICTMPHEFPCGGKSTCCAPIGQSEERTAALEPSIAQLGTAFEVLDVKKTEVLQKHPRRPKMKFGGVGLKIYLVAGVCFLVALGVHYTNPGFFAMCGASCLYLACLWLAVAECAMLAAPALGLVAFIRVRWAYKKRMLITDGIYSICRHPCYALFLVWLCGVALSFRSWAMLVVPLVAYVAARILIRSEERVMIQRFGRAYLDYQKEVNPFFPTLRRGHRGHDW